MAQLKLGKRNLLKVLRIKEHGVYLEGGDIGDILLPKRYVPEGTKVGDTLDVFLYLDQEERPIATTETPLAKVGDFAYLKCTWVNEYGAFLDWGLMKNVFCPFHEQKKKMEIGESYIVYLYIDKESYRIAATAKVDRWLDNPNETGGLRPGQHVSLLVWQKTDLGFKVIIDNHFGGLVYQDQIFQYIHTGDRIDGYIQNVRPDGKVDVTLQPTGRRLTTDFAETLLQWLKDNGGHCDLGDKSDAEDIKRRFQVSKKTYKRAIGELYKRRLITLEETGISLV